MIYGDTIALRALEHTDLETLRDWRNRSHYRKFFREYRELNLENQKRWFDTAVVHDRQTLMFGVVQKDTCELIGVCGLAYINWVHRHADLSLYIGKDDIYIDSHEGGFAWQTMDVLLKYAFDEINLHKVWCEIYAFDRKKHELFERYGLHQDGVLPDNYFYDGEYQDSHLFSILDREWRGRLTS